MPVFALPLNLGVELATSPAAAAAIALEGYFYRRPGKAKARLTARFPRLGDIMISVSDRSNSWPK
jgi:hypothetical protein